MHVQGNVISGKCTFRETYIRVNLVSAKCFSGNVISGRCFLERCIRFVLPYVVLVFLNENSTNEMWYGSGSN